DQWPLFDIRASRLAEDEYRLHFGFNMQLFDLASIELIAADCKYLYHGETACLEPLEISFRDLVLCEHQFGTVPEAKRSDRYWRERFSLLPEAIDVTDVSSGGGKPQFVHHHSVLEREDWREIKGIAKQHGITASMVVFAAFNEVLSAYGGRQHYTLESRVFRRLPLHKNILGVAGQFIAGIVSEVDFRGKSTFRERCQGLEGQVWRDLENGYVDAARLWQGHRAMPPKTPAIVYTSTVARFENFVQFGAEPPMKWFGEQVFSCYQMPNLGIEFYVVESDGALESHWFVNDALFAEGKSAKMFADYLGLLNALATEEDAWHKGPVFSQHYLVGDA
ncbi:MAG: condensation domain-containing protein, partial [Gammaproteobacteria bacterium]